MGDCWVLEIEDKDESVDLGIRTFWERGNWSEVGHGSCLEKFRMQPAGERSGGRTKASIG